MTALEFTTNFLIRKLKSTPSETRSIILELACYEKWVDLLSAVEENKNDLVDWILTELGSWSGCETFDFKENIVDEDWFESIEGGFYVFELDGKFIKVSYSNFENMCYQTIEFDFVEQKEILVPTKVWTVIE